MSSSQMPTDAREGQMKRRIEPDAVTVAEKAEAERLFKLENADAFASMNEWVEKNGLPLAKFRQF